MEKEGEGEEGEEDYAATDGNTGDGACADALGGGVRHHVGVGGIVTYCYECWMKRPRGSAALETVKLEVS